MVFLVASTLAAVFFIYFSSRLLMNYYLIIDRDAGVFDSLFHSWELCRDKVGTIILVMFVQFAIVLAGFLAFCVGIGLCHPACQPALSGHLSGPDRARTSREPGKPEFIWERIDA